MSNENTPVRVTAKTKFSGKSVEGVAIRSIKAREKKVGKVGATLVGLWIEQGIEILDFIAITGASQRLSAELLGIKRTAVNTYCTIASDPRLCNPEFQPKLENFTQKELIKLTKIDDEEVFDTALETGELPKAEVIDVEVEDVEDVEAPDRSWADELIDIINKSLDKESCYSALSIVVAGTVEDFVEPVIDANDVEDSDEDGNAKLLAEAIELSGRDDLDDQAIELGIKKSVLKRALAGAKLSSKSVATLTEYVNS